MSRYESFYETVAEEVPEEISEEVPVSTEEIIETTEPEQSAEWNQNMKNELENMKKQGPFAFVKMGLFYTIKFIITIFAMVHCWRCYSGYGTMNRIIFTLMSGSVPEFYLLIHYLLKGWGFKCLNEL